MEQTELAKRMFALPDRDNLPIDHELRVKGKAFEEACEHYLVDTPTITVAKFMGAWARARRCYCDYTGKALI